MITLSDLSEVLKLFHYRASEVDSIELRFWIFNNDLISPTPKFFREDLVYIDSDKLIQTLKQEYLNMGFVSTQYKANEGARGMSGIHQEARDHILTSKGNDLLNVLRIFH